MTTIDHLFNERSAKPHPDALYADIWEHLPTLKLLASRVSHITEFGVRTGNSTVGFLAGLAIHGGEMVSYEINAQQFAAPEIEGVSWKFIQSDTADLKMIDRTDILFLDSCHTLDHITHELRFASSVRHFILMHDTSSTWIGGDQPRRARDSFLETDEGRKWRFISHWDNCNGLSLLERIK